MNRLSFFILAAFFSFASLALADENPGVTIRIYGTANCDDCEKIRKSLIQNQNLSEMGAQGIPFYSQGQIKVEISKQNYLVNVEYFELTAESEKSLDKIDFKPWIAHFDQFVGRFPGIDIVSGQRVIYHYPFQEFMTTHLHRNFLNKYGNNPAYLVNQVASMMVHYHIFWNRAPKKK